MPKKGNMLSSFIDKLLMSTYAPDSKMHYLPEYDIFKIDHVDYMIKFQYNILLHKGPNGDNLYCRLFLESFIREALAWFTELKPRFITSWEDFCTLFIDRFKYNCSMRKTMQL